MSEHKPPKMEQGKYYPPHETSKHTAHQQQSGGPHMPPPSPHMNKGMEHNKDMQHHPMPPQMEHDGCTGQGIPHSSQCMGQHMGMPHMGHGCMPHMEKPMQMKPQMPMQHEEHKQKMYEQCMQNMNQKVKVQTVKGHLFNAVIEHVDAENVYFILMDEDDPHGERQYGYGGGIGRLMIPLIFLAAISATGGWGW